MTTDNEKSPLPFVPPQWPDIPSLLSSTPQTDPAVLQAFTDDRLRAAHYSALGQVVAAWANFESLLDFWLMVFAKLEEGVGVCFTSQISGSGPRIDGFIALVRYLGAANKWLTNLEKFANDARGLSLQRNRAVHDVWDMHLPSSPLRFEVSAKRAVRVVQIHVPTEELLHLVENIETLRERFEDMALEINVQIRASHGTPPSDTTP